MRAEQLACRRVASLLPELAEWPDGGPPDAAGGPGSAAGEALAHVRTCLRCQAELARYRRLLRLLAQLRTHRPAVPAGGVARVLATLEERAEAGARRSLGQGRRTALVAAVALSAAAAAGTSLLALSKVRDARRRAEPSRMAS